MRPHRWQATRLLHPWDSPGKKTGVGCHFLLQCMKVKSESEVDQSCLTPSDPMECSPPGSSIHGICQARVLEWGAIAFYEPVHLKRDPKYSLEGLMLKLKLQYSGHLMWRTDSLEKTLMLERLSARQEGSDRGWDGWMASLTQHTWVCANSERQWRTREAWHVQSNGSQRAGHDLATEQSVKM